MHCFNHRDSAAVGCCKACGKGLCGDCVVDLGHGLSCKGPHEGVVESYSRILKFNSRAISQAPRTALLAPAFFVAMGAIFIGFGYDRYESAFNFSTIMGAVFLIYGALVFVRARATYSQNRA